MSSLVWLHLSDWHQKGPDFDREVVRNALLEDLRHRAQIDSRLGRVDLVIFSGDLAWAGEEHEYEAAGREFLSPVMAAAGVERDHLILVPGNHDLRRSTLELLAPGRSLLDRRERISETLRDRDAREVLLAPMRAYSRFVREYLGDRAPHEPAYSFLRAFEIRGLRAAVVGMNSAWMCGQHKERHPRTQLEEVNDYGHLILAEPQYYDPTQLPEFQQAAVRIGVLHHPLAWLSDVVPRAAVEHYLEATFHFLLRGHEHAANVSLPSGPRSHCAVISAGAAYERGDHPNGYSFVHLDLATGRGTVFLRRYDRDTGFDLDLKASNPATPGLFTFALPKDLGGVSDSPVRSGIAAEAPSVLAVDLVEDAASLDLLAALELYAERIPENEQFQAPDIVRWLRDDQAARAEGAGPRCFFFVAKRRNRVCGFTLIHYYQAHRLAFIAYLVAKRRIGTDNGTVSSRLMNEVAKLFQEGGELALCEGLLLEVDDPRFAGNDTEKRERLARVRLFCTLAQQAGFSLRGLDFEYRQPLLELPTQANRGGELRMLLMYARRQADWGEGTLPASRVRALLDFVYHWLYPTGFSEIAAENDAYQRYLGDFFTAQVAVLHDRVRALALGQIRTRSDEA